MSTDLLTLNGKKVPTEASDKHVINININQESSLSYLFKAVGQHWGREGAATQKTLQPSASAPNTSDPFRLHCNGEQKVLGGAQILLGIVCISLGVVIDNEHFFSAYIQAGAPYWMGGLFVLSGILSVVSERRGSYWVQVATFFNLASVVAGIVALTKGIAHIPDLNGTFSWRKDMCERRHEYPPYVTTRDYEPDWRESTCKETLWNLMGVAFAVRILLLIFSAVALAIAFFCFGYGLRVMCRTLKARSQAYVSVGDLEVPPPYQDQVSPEIIA
ncbi:membrane-spanning 4-domains subfamily A member 6C-like [Rhineura floridana]|uniref:membrane-spanning 4-domains subfamily A member 6C-like n=1 Tax=Rhineura floridana TaxID=261503 RepID=UPI002AC82D4A|nr:membrane-spanning 4-domains subfamily A member 6C-like [Rhineura floridana]